MNMQRHDELIDQWNSESAPTQSTLPAASEAAHTPTPWTVNGHYIHDPDTGMNIACLGLGEGGDVFTSEDAANATFIITACNSHSANLERIKKLEDALEEIAKVGDYDERNPLGVVQEIARSALSHP